MTRVLVLGELGVVVPDAAVEAIEPSMPESGSSPPWLPELLDDGTSEPRPSERRTLRLVGGGRVEVPATMRIDEVEVLELPPLLRLIAEGRGVIGITEIGERLGLVCDPRLLPVGPPAGGGPPPGGPA